MHVLASDIIIYCLRWAQKSNIVSGSGCGHIGNAAIHHVSTLVIELFSTRSLHENKQISQKQTLPLPRFSASGLG